MSAYKIILFLTCAATCASASLPATSYLRPLSFEPNRGQGGEQVDFLAHGLNYSLALSRAEAVMAGRGTIARMKPLSANQSTTGELLDPLRGKSNYFIGSDPAKWRTDVPTYARVRYRDVYPGVDLIYYGNQRQLEYDFIVRPGADTRTIALELQGVGTAGEAGSAPFVLQKPMAYQEIGTVRKTIECAYVRIGTRLAFELGAYDTTKPLVIDPVIVYSTFFGGSGGDSGNAIALDNDGNIYVTGSTASWDDFPTKDPYQSILKGYTNAFVTKFNAAGTALVYSTYFGGSGGYYTGDSGNGIAVDKSGHAYIVGSTTSTNFPTQGAFQSTLKSAYGNGFVAELASSGAELVFSTYLGGSGGSYFGADAASGVALGPGGNPYVVGTTYSKDFPTKNPFQSSLKSTNSGNAFVTKLTSTGALVYSTYLGGSGADTGAAVAIDSHANAYVTGSTTSTDFPVEHPFQSSNNAFEAPSNVFVTKFNSAGNGLVYSTYLGGSGGFYECDGGFFCGYLGDGGSGIAIDALGQAHVTGFTDSSDFPTKNPFQPQQGVSSLPTPNAFVTTFSADGTLLVFSSYLGGSGSVYSDEGDNTYPIGDSGTGIALDDAGNSHVTGSTYSKDFPVKDAFQSTNKSFPNSAAFITKVSSAGALVYSSYLGGSTNDAAAGVVVAGAGTAYITGTTYSPDFPLRNPFQNSLQGTSNAFVTKVSSK